MCIPSVLTVTVDVLIANIPALDVHTAYGGKRCTVKYVTLNIAVPIISSVFGKIMLV